MSCTRKLVTPMSILDCQFSDKPVPPKGPATLTEALKRLGVEVTTTRLEQDYNAGRTTQVPTCRVVAVRGRIRRKIGYDGVSLTFERSGPAPH